MARFPSFSTPRRSGEDEPWFRIGNLDVNTTTFVALAAALSMLAYAIDKASLRHLFLSSETFEKMKLWQIVTWPIPNAPDIWVVFMIYLFWSFGSQLEGLMGKRRYLWFVGALIIVPALVVGLYGLATSTLFFVGGLRYLELGVFLAFAIEFPGAQFFFGIPARIIAIVVFVVEVLQALGDRDGATGLSALVLIAAVAATSILALRSVGLGADVAWAPKIPLPASLSGARTGARSSKANRKKASDRKGAPNLTVVDNPTFYTDQKDIDAVLDKIAASGIDSLSASERAILNDASKRRRNQ